jgi:hypothetical protein
MGASKVLYLNSFNIEVTGLFILNSLDLSHDAINFYFSICFLSYKGFFLRFMLSKLLAGSFYNWLKFGFWPLHLTYHKFYFMRCILKALIDLFK